MIVTSQRIRNGRDEPTPSTHGPRSRLGYASSRVGVVGRGSTDLVVAAHAASDTPLECRPYIVWGKM
jgi:hypothetical protein